MVDNYIFDLEEDVTRTPVSYKNRYGITIAADLYRPKDFDESQHYPALFVVGEHAFSRYVSDDAYDLAAAAASLGG